MGSYTWGYKHGNYSYKPYWGTYNPTSNCPRTSKKGVIPQIGSTALRFRVRLEGFGLRASSGFRV